MCSVQKSDKIVNRLLLEKLGKKKKVKKYYFWVNEKDKKKNIF